MNRAPRRAGVADVFAAVFALCGLAGCSKPAAGIGGEINAPAIAVGTEAERVAAQRAEAAAADLGKALRLALQARMAEGGPVAAVDFCQAQAPAITASVARQHGVAMGRTSLRWRNPGNRPSPWQQAALDEFAARAQAGEAPEQLRYQRRQGGQLHYARGIRTEAACLLCHGSTVAEPIAAAIAAHYPQDAATGFAEGDLRGMLWVEIPVDMPPP
ncbi:Tll0287-like domain-containing protein [Pseudoxanthomonas wuyuanensis]